MRGAAAAHDAEVAAANKQLRQVQAAEQRAVQEEAAQQADAQQRIKCEQRRCVVLLLNIFSCLLKYSCFQVAAVDAAAAVQLGACRIVVPCLAHSYLMVLCRCSCRVCWTRSIAHTASLAACIIFPTI